MNWVCCPGGSSHALHGDAGAADAHAEGARAGYDKKNNNNSSNNDDNNDNNNDDNSR